MQSAKLFSKEKVIGMWNLSGKNQIINKLGLWSWWFPSLYMRCHILLGAWVQPSVPNDHHVWSLYKSNLWCSPQHTQQIDFMVSLEIMPWYIELIIFVLIYNTDDE